MAAEASATAMHPPHTLMARAGWAVARLAVAIAPHARRIQVVCGPGNNGGDGLLAALHLRRLGLDVRAHHLSAGTLPVDAAWALQAAVDGGVHVTPDLPLDALAQNADLCIDALLGLGSSRPLQGPMAQWAAQTTGRPLLAVDLPSGLDPDRGTSLGGGPVVQARHTLALLTLKPGLFTALGRDRAGEVWFDDLGVAPGPVAPTAWLWNGASPADRPHASHKGRFGDLVVVGGAPGMVGAAMLAGEAALAAGAGRVYLSALDVGSVPAALRRPELMTRPRWWEASPQELSSATVVCGCGGGSAVASALPRLLAHAPRLVLDADALNALAGENHLAALLTARPSNGQQTVLTPHPLEAARLLARTTTEVQADRLGAAQALADRYGATVVLKGSGSIVASAGTPPSINASGNAALASAGTGDVLAGWIGGQWASCSERAAHDLLSIVRDSVWVHGHAADQHGARTPLRAADLIERMHHLTGALGSPGLPPVKPPSI